MKILRAVLAAALLSLLAVGCETGGAECHNQNAVGPPLPGNQSYAKNHPTCY